LASRSFILNLSATDRPGIVAALSGHIFEQGANILESHQFSDPETGRFFLRTAFETGTPATPAALQEGFARKLGPLGADTVIHDAEARPRIVAMVSRFDHALLHLLYQIRVGWIGAEVAAIVSNHEDAAPIAAREGVPFHHWPVTPDTKPAQEARLLALVEETGSELVVLARYMQVLSDELCRQLHGRAINIHHSFLPAFKGANPYRRAHARGVKMIGATAHYVTADLDEGPIIEQDIARVGHAMTAANLVAEGRNVEARALAWAVKMHLERRVMINGAKTVVFA
jgi:formyltetrahydrofolate deformylase